MKTLGLIGGLTWHSTLEYYRGLNQGMNDRLGDVHSASLLMYSVDFAKIRDWTIADNWTAIADHMITYALKLEASGAEALLIGANTMHHIADQVQAALRIPVIHIASVTAAAIRKQGFSKVLLLGTRYTMQLPFYREKLAVQGINMMIPDELECESINTSIYQEMSKGVFLESRKDEFLELIARYEALGAQAVILGCTEIPVLLRDRVIPIPAFDTLQLHVQAGVDFALG